MSRCLVDLFRQNLVLPRLEIECLVLAEFVFVTAKASIFACVAGHVNCYCLWLGRHIHYGYDGILL